MGQSCCKSIVSNTSPTTFTITRCVILVLDKTNIISSTSPLLPKNHSLPACVRVRFNTFCQANSRQSEAGSSRAHNNGDEQGLMEFCRRPRQSLSHRKRPSTISLDNGSCRSAFGFTTSPLAGCRWKMCDAPRALGITIGVKETK